MHNHGPKNASQAKDFKASIKKLFSYDRKLFRWMIIGWVSAALASILALIGPDKIKEITNTITAGILTGIDTSTISKIGWTLVVIFSLSFLFNYIEGLVMAYVTTTYTKTLRREVSSKINRLPLFYFDKTTVGDTLSRMTNDIDTIGHTMNQSFSTLVVAVTMFIGSLFMMIKTSPVMALTAVVSTIIGFLFMMVILRRSQKYFVKVQEELGVINGHIEEAYSGHNVIKAYNAEDEFKKEFEEINERLFENGRKSQFFSGLMHPIMSFIGNFGYVAVCIVGAILTMKGNISFGVIVAFMIYIRLFTQPLTQFAQAVSQLQSTAAA
ncbi:MAG TPA: ABC transporter, partial [Firmicutes bacterium]|nr:ABC transporter [Bacillota bacterium]